ncbi:hypothetical protein LA6_001443 [Marinibacterium anthonyi]|nr:hypothetical protein LA6_001443 [Marinibacterium anthonyi]
MKEDRDVNVFFPLKASQVEPAREMTAALAEFPTIAWNYSERFLEILNADQIGPSESQDLLALATGLRQDAERAERMKRALAPVILSAVISDPHGKGGPIQ